MEYPAFRFILFLNGILLMILSGLMAIPAVADGVTGNADWQVFAGSAAVTLFSGVMLVLANRGGVPDIGHRTGYLLTVSCWLVVAAFGSVPLAMSSLNLSITDAFFETMSGLTTTGSTVLSGLDHMAPGLLLWRSLLQWIGGIGIVVMAIVLLPAMRIGGMQLFRTESSDISGKAVPRIYHYAVITALVYLGLSLACAFSYRIAGMNWFDAVNHAMTTIATGGLSTKDASFGYFHSAPIELVGIVFMTAGALPLILYARFIMEGRDAFRGERQVLPFLLMLAGAIFLMTAWNVAHNDMPLETALRQSAFNVTSILTDTGYATTDFSAWGSFAVGLFFILFLIGGCAGSTAGGIKIFRWRILFTGASRQLQRMLSPHRVLAVRYGDRPVDADMLASVRNFFFVYLMTFLALSLGCMASGLDFVSSISAVAQGMANAGPGLGPIVGPATTFAAIPAVAKWLVAAGMLLGRLELMTVYVLVLREFWRR